MAQNENNNHGITLIDLMYALIQVMFIYIKITEQVNWTWFQIMYPTTIMVAMALVLYGTLSILHGLGIGDE